MAGIACNGEGKGLHGLGEGRGYLWIGWRWKEKVREKSIWRERILHTL